MTTYLDTSALLARYLRMPAGDVVAQALGDDDAWCASELARTETLMAIDRVVTDPVERVALRQALLDDWRSLWVVPLDSDLLERAAELGRQHPLRTGDAIHLASADRLGRPTRLVTFDSRQIPVALAMGLDVVST